MYVRNRGSVNGDALRRVSLLTRRWEWSGGAMGYWDKVREYWLMAEAVAERLDHALLGRVGVDYRLKGRSEDVETHRSVIKASDGTKCRVNAHVIPGDESSERTKAFKQDFGHNGRRPV